MVGLIISSWSDNEIVLGGFGSALGTNGQGLWYIMPGDPLVISVFTSSRQADYSTTVQPAPPPATHDVAVINVISSYTQVTVGDTFSIYVTVQNEGTQIETFSVTAYYGTGKIGFDTEVVTLDAGENKTLNMRWDTTGVVPNSYQIGANASQVPDETNTANNDCPDGTVVIKGLPDSPKDLTAEPMNNRVNLIWTAPSKPNVQRYYIFRGTTPDFEIPWPDYHATVDGSTLRFTDSVSEDIIYYYKVVASFSEGFSKPSDPVGCARLESYKGVRNEVTGATTISAGSALFAFSFQQNFFIQCGKDGRKLWCQSTIQVAVQADKRIMMSDFEVWDYAVDPDRPLWKTGYWLSPSVPDKIYFDSEIYGTTILFKNSAGSALLSLAELDIVVSGDVYIVQDTFQTNFVIVGNSGGANINFESGEGYVSCKTIVGGSLREAQIQNVVENKGGHTKETSSGLAWDLTGHFWHDGTSDKEGLYFGPNYSSPASQPSSFEILGKPTRALVLSAKCPVYLDLYDEFGRCAGYNSASGLIETQIPSVFWVSNCSMYIFDPSGMYRLIVVGTEDGTFTLQITLQNETGSTTVLMNETDTITHGASKSWVLSPTIEGNYTVSAVSSLSASINPLSASILAGQSVTFTSTVFGGILPYSYQWYLDGAPVSGAISNTSMFTPAASGIYYIYVKVTDDFGNTAQSETARIVVATVPVGGYSIPLQVQTKAEPVLPYIALIATLTAILTKLKTKTKRKR
jgi:hypothetical protein